MLVNLILNICQMHYFYTFIYTTNIYIFFAPIKIWLTLIWIYTLGLCNNCYKKFYQSSLCLDCFTLHVFILFIMRLLSSVLLSLWFSDHSSRHLLCFWSVCVFSDQPFSLLLTHTIDFPTSLYQPPIAFNVSEERCCRQSLHSSIGLPFCVTLHPSFFILLRCLEVKQHFSKTVQ